MATNERTVSDAICSIWNASLLSHGIYTAYRTTRNKQARGINLLASTHTHTPLCHQRRIEPTVLASLVINHNTCHHHHHHHPLLNWTLISEAHTHTSSARPPLLASYSASLAPPSPESPDTSPKPACLVLATPSSPPPVSSTLLVVPGGPDGFAFQSLPPSAHRAGGVAAPVGVARCAAGAGVDDADAGDGVGVVGVVAPVAVVVEVEVVAGAVAVAGALVVAVHAAVRAVAPADVAAAVGVAAGAESMTHKARGECWVRQVPKVLMVVEVVVAVAGDE